MPKSERACWLASTSWPTRSTTIWATGPVSNEPSRRWNRSPASGSPPSPSAAPSSRSRRDGRGTLRNTRPFVLTGVNTSARVISISALPRKRYPRWFSEKWKWRRIRVWVSALKYMSVFRQISRSMREIGASCTRSLRPKITVRRRSVRKVMPAGVLSK